MKPAYASREVAPERASARGLALHWTEFRLALLAADAAIVLAVMLAVVTLWERVNTEFTPTELYEVWFVGTWLLWLVALRSSGAYDLLAPNTARGNVGALMRALAIVVGATLVAYFFAPRSFPRSTSLLALVPVFAALLAWRGLIVSRLTRWRALHRRVLLLGIGDTTTRLAAVLAAPARAVPYEPVAFVTDRTDVGATVAGVPVRHGTARIWEHVRDLAIQEVSVCREEAIPSSARDALVDAFGAGVTVSDAVRLYEDLTGRVPIAQIGPTWYAELPSLPRRPYHVLKRAIDVVASAALVVVLAPAMALIALAILIDDGRPIFYRQVRLGRRGERFAIRKFRSMRRDAETEGAQYAARNDPRATRVGRVLRPSGLDELPQLWQVLVGHMSLIGPRAERPEFSAQLSEKLPLYRARLLVRPGIAGWAEVHVPHAASLDEHLERLEYDLYYLKRADLLLDLNVALRALSITLSGRR